MAGIVEAAKRHDANAIVVGSRGENALSRAVLGSVAASVLTACPAKDERGLDFTKTQREALDKVKSLEQAVQEGAKRAEGADRP